MQVNSHRPHQTDVCGGERERGRRREEGGEGTEREHMCVVIVTVIVGRIFMWCFLYGRILLNALNTCILFIPYNSSPLR